MKTDRELLELAAKAYWGDEIDDVCSIRWLELDQAIGYTHGDNQDHNGIDLELVWNPITDDGAALRLAVRLGMNVEVNLDDGCTRIRDEFGSLVLRNMFLDGDADAATRRSIVRAAAAIGENMK